MKIRAGYEEKTKKKRKKNGIRQEQTYMRSGN